MKCTKRMFMGAVIAILMANMASPTFAWSYGGAYWHNGIAPVQKDSSIPSSWSSSLTAAASTWSNAGPDFQFSWMVTNNKLYYRSLGANGAIASTHPINSGDSMTSCTVEFNRDLSWSTSGASGNFDVQSIATHEFGHWLWLGHSTNPEATMYKYASKGETKKRTLHSDDLTGLVYLYGNDKVRL